MRLRSWEYWPFWVVYAPIGVYWLWLSVKARSFFFFSAANPSILTGGLLGESKKSILDKIDTRYKPETLLIKAGTPIKTVCQLLSQKGIRLPVIAKPDVGERGWQVEKIERYEGLVDYLRQQKNDFLIQEYVDEPLEFGVFYYRLPGQVRGVVTSIVRKEFLGVRGNGYNCIEELIAQNERAILQLPALRQQWGKRLHEIPASGVEVLLVPIGNHSRGTKFMNANHLITPELTARFDEISGSIDGFYYGRYDLRCRTIADLTTGQHLKIMELNGAGAEPAHIYQPGFPILEAYRVLFHHWNLLYRISRENNRRGVRYMTLSESWQIWKQLKAKKA
ncbi:MAG: hypothetical protein BGO59_08465 [Spirosoma sp. 48-14]|nr:MAG: hypothetical protein BGO59_08465 [Spirosoma sp. 48-14]